MKKVNLRMKELNKYDVIKELVDHNRNKIRAKEKLGLSIRQINRLIKIYTMFLITTTNWAIKSTLNRTVCY